MDIKKPYVWLWIIFIIVLGFRLYFVFQTPNLNYDGYFAIRQVEHIKITGLPLFKDSLSFGGRTLVFMPFFYYVLALPSLFFPTAIICKILPNIFAALLVFATYLIAKKLTDNEEAAIFTAFISGFIPIFVDQTLNSVSVYSLILPLMFYGIYCLMNIEKEDYTYRFILILFVLLLMHTSSLLLILGFIFYLVIQRLAKMKQSRAELEIIFFSLFFILWLYFIVYKNVFLFHGAGMIWQNIPRQIISKYFQEINILEAIYKIGYIPFFYGIYTIYMHLFKEKNKCMNMLIGLWLCIATLLWLKLIQPAIGLIFLGAVMVMLFSLFYKASFIVYIKKSRFAKFRTLTLIFFYIVLLSTSILPSIAYAKAQPSVSHEEMEALKWIKENTPADSVILASVEEGQLINAVAQRKSVIDSNFMFIEDSDQIFQDVKTAYTTYYETDAIRVFDKYGINYIYISNKTKDSFEIDKLRYIEERCFDLVYDKEVQIYKILCRMEK